LSCGGKDFLITHLENIGEKDFLITHSENILKKNKKNVTIGTNPPFISCLQIQNYEA
jgi:anaerobic C4-dicarboxylate transporter